METKAFRVDWYFHDAFVDFSILEAEEIGVLVQIINLIYIRGGSVDNNPKYIGKHCNLGKARCTRVINSLIHKGQIYLDESGEISKKRCELELKAIAKRRKKSSENGKKGAETRWGDEEFQRDSDGQAINGGMANTSTKNNTNINTTPLNPPTPPSRGEGGKPANCLPRGYNIEHHLNDEGRDAARSAALGQDMHGLMGIYNEGINTGKRAPPIYPNKAFPAWCLKYNKGKSF
ncbi:MAG TPA: hypothetical protein PLO23_00830 [Alphaproteobacteria bacterium]|nr:hypothetical protein [Alphaproteobacteria bacterium]